MREFYPNMSLMIDLIFSPSSTICVHIVEAKYKSIFVQWWYLISSQVPEVGNKTLYIPLVDNETEELASCREFRDPSDHGAGTQACSGGYEFSFEGENEMTITAEVSMVKEDGLRLNLTTLEFRLCS